MKKIFKAITCAAMCLSLSGCLSEVYHRSAENNIEEVCSDCAVVANTETLVSNVEKVMRRVGGIRADYTLTNTKSTYNLAFDLILKDEKINWEGAAVANYGDIEVSLYMKDKKLYVVYPHNGANVILKDEMVKTVEELDLTLDTLNVQYDKELLEEIVIGDKFAGFGFDRLSQGATYVENENNTYTIFYRSGGIDWEYDISSNFLITEIRSSANNFTSKLVVEYPEKLTIEYPNGLDVLTLNIEDAKRLLEIDNFANLLDPDTKK